MFYINFFTRQTYDYPRNLLKQKKVGNKNGRGRSRKELGTQPLAF